MVTISSRIISEEVKVATHKAILKLHKDENASNEEAMGKQFKPFSSEPTKECKNLLSTIKSSFVIEWMAKKCNLDFIQCILHVILLVLFIELGQLVCIIDSWTELVGSYNTDDSQIFLGISLLLLIIVMYVWFCSPEHTNKTKGDTKRQDNSALKEKENIIVSSEQKGYA